MVPRARRGAAGAQRSDAPGGVCRPTKGRAARAQTRFSLPSRTDPGRPPAESGPAGTRRRPSVGRSAGGRPARPFGPRLAQASPGADDLGGDFGLANPLRGVLPDNAGSRARKWYACGAPSSLRVHLTHFVQSSCPDRPDGARHTQFWAMRRYGAHARSGYQQLRERQHGDRQSLGQHHTYDKGGQLRHFLPRGHLGRRRRCPQAVNAWESGCARQTSALYLNYGAASVAQRLSRIIELTLVPSRVSSVEP